VSFSNGLRLAALAVAVALGVSLWFAWKGERTERAQLTADLKAAQQSLAEASQRQTTRDAALQKLIAALENKKSTVNTPAQIVTDLPAELPLPTAIAMETGNCVGPKTHSQKGCGTGAALDAVLPNADLKPLYDFAVDCRECQAKLTAAQADLKDEQDKTVAVGKERDSALQAAKGGSVWRRVGRAAKWFAIGAAAGAVAARVAR
jgi:hypothetical protein